MSYHCGCSSADFSSPFPVIQNISYSLGDPDLPKTFDELSITPVGCGYPITTSVTIEFFTNNEEYSFDNATRIFTVKSTNDILILGDYEFTVRSEVTFYGVQKVNERTFTLKFVRGCNTALI